MSEKNRVIPEEGQREKLEPVNMQKIFDIWDLDPEVKCPGMFAD